MILSTTEEISIKAHIILNHILEIPNVSFNQSLHTTLLAREKETEKRKKKEWKITINNVYQKEWKFVNH